MKMYSNKQIEILKIIVRQKGSCLGIGCMVCPLRAQGKDTCIHFQDDESLLGAKNILKNIKLDKLKELLK